MTDNHQEQPENNHHTEEERKIPAKRILYLRADTETPEDKVFADNVHKQIEESMDMLRYVGPGISVFGSARFTEDHPFYKDAVEFGRRIAKMNFTTITGGGPGVMEAANRGAFEEGGRSVGLNIVLPHEQHENPYLTDSFTFDFFFVRKVMLVKYSYAFIIMPGGFGTMDEFYETLTLVQTQTIEQFPIVLFGKEYYSEIIDSMEKMAKDKTISPYDLDLVLITDSHDEAMEHIKKYINQNYIIVQKRKKNDWWKIDNNKRREKKN